ncbi:osmoprotectant ABC transporter substrate-binding protein [Peptostreptococcus faecalis]|uniref:osmoprotectant ABC transporter substrate-binding protein n=1 Tax=Peptostreptococcus faecalis TaxID=2045015 RepID=UPI000C796430|nr:osmoprotectant ABC transporter substrate-binding protein [Peptostreptococcus faecalis]
MKNNFLKKILTSLAVVIACTSLTACSLPGLGGSVKDDIVIAGGNTTERQITSEIVAQMIKHYKKDANTSIINNLGSTMLVFQTLTGGEANVSGCMYTGTSLTGELGLPATTDAKKAEEQVVKGYSDKFNITWFPSYGFENTYAFMVRRDFAEKNNLKTVSDLQKLAPQIMAGVDSSWTKREGDGYEAFKQKYGFDFKSVYPMEIGLVYNAVNRGEMDVVLGYSTDGRINAYDLVLLEDDKQLFPPYNGSPAATNELLKKYPEIEEILLKLEGVIDSKTMQELNQMSDGDKIEPNIVAKKFLEKNNYFESKKPTPLSERPLYKDLNKDKN